MYLRVGKLAFEYLSLSKSFPKILKLSKLFCFFMNLSGSISAKYTLSRVVNKSSGEFTSSSKGRPTRVIRVRPS